MHGHPDCLALQREDHGISPRDVATAPSFKALEPQIVEAMRGVDVAIYNAAFDKGFMTRPILSAPRRFICVMETFQEAAPGEKWNLQNALLVCRYTQRKTHRAVDDCVATKFVWDALERRYGNGFPGLVARAATTVRG